MKREMRLTCQAVSVALELEWQRTVAEKINTSHVSGMVAAFPVVRAGLVERLGCKRRDVYIYPSAFDAYQATRADNRVLPQHGRLKH